ncbi:hypothetical protein LIER_30271 [Lithospermum erythrorhizon]|uniref:Uncharacterized protein n=1 Tax=Lithospermum erythrorhizon TaxID=34254 RepID=A0AAV3RNS7_LITER
MVKDVISLEEVRYTLHNMKLRHRCSGPSSDRANSSQGFLKSGKKNFPKKLIKTAHRKCDCRKKRQGHFNNTSGTIDVAEGSTKYEEAITLVANNNIFYTNEWIPYS